MSSIPQLNVSSLLHTRTTHPAFSATEVDDPADGAPYEAYPLAWLFLPLGAIPADGFQYQWPDCGPCSCLKGIARKRSDWLTTAMLRLPSGRIAARYVDVHGNEKWVSMTPLISYRQAPPTGGGSIWYQMLEKLIAIVVGRGSFNTMSGAAPFQVFQALGIPVGYYSDGTNNWFKNVDDLGVALKKMMANKEVWVVGTGGRSIIPGIMQSHYYSVVQQNDDGTIYLSNPLGEYYDLDKVQPADFIAQFSNEIEYGFAA